MSYIIRLCNKKEGMCNIIGEFKFWVIDLLTMKVNKFEKYLN